MFKFCNNCWLNIISFSFCIKFSSIKYFSSILFEPVLKLVDIIEQIVLYVMVHKEHFLQMVHQFEIQFVHKHDEDVLKLHHKYLLEQSNLQKTTCFLFKEKKINNSFTSRLAVVHLCPAVPTAAKKTAGIASVRSASSIIIIQLFPPNSRIVFPKRA